MLLLDDKLIATKTMFSDIHIKNALPAAEATVWTEETADVCWSKDVCGKKSFVIGLSYRFFISIVSCQ